MLINLAIGGLIFFNNYHRQQNVQFFLFTIVMFVWGCFVLSIITYRHETHLGWLVRGASYFSTLIPVAFHLLCLSITHSSERFRDLLYRARFSLIISQIAGAICFVPGFLRHVTLVDPQGSPLDLPEVTYGPLFPVYTVYFAVFFIWLIYFFTRTYKGLSGIMREEFRFILLGMSVTTALGLITNVLMPIISGSAQSQPFGPITVVAMNAIIAYGIATQRIMDVADILRRGLAYCLLLTYLVILYYAVWFLASRLAGPWFPYHLPHLLAALAVAFSMAPVHGRMQEFANRLFITARSVDLESTMQEANRILQSVTRLDALLDQFGSLIRRAMGTDRVCLLLRNGDDYEQEYPPAIQAEQPPIRLSQHEVLAGLLTHSDEPLIADLIARKRPTPALAAVAARMKELGFAAAMGIHYKDSLEGIMLLGTRLSGRIYGASEQDLLALLGNQLGVAIENAKLYTEVQDGRIYNNILLDSLVSGVVAANKDGEITVFNQEAQRITGVNAESAVGRHLQILPAPLRQALLTTMTTQQAIRDQEYTIRKDETASPMAVRAGTTAFWGHHGGLLGALVVFSDTTRVKALEEQIRRHDRLASIGTLSAGMAHEIKNPLVSIKTFTELLPNRYDDVEFRERFSSLVSAEVNRIDRIVNQLLRFARPAKAHLVPAALHDVLESSLLLIDQQMAKKHIRLRKRLDAPNDLIEGDADLLQQAFINFFMNAMDAMDENGILRVSTHEMIVGDEDDDSREEFGVNHSIHLSIEDTGPGIPEEDIAHVFDPFFTTKSAGTGLGLAVAHGILAEHHAVTQVQSRPGEGTVFRIAFPLLHGRVPA